MVKKNFFKFISIIIFISFIFTGCSSTNKETNTNSTSSVKNVAHKTDNKNYATFQLDNVSKHIEILDDAIKQYDVFLTGENHYIDVNLSLKMYFLKYFVTNGDIKYFIPEISHSIACNYEQYLKTGDENILNTLCKKQHLSPLETNDTIKNWKDLKNFYDTLPENKRFDVIGIDVEGLPNIAADYIYKKITEKKVSNNLPLLNEFKKIYEANDLDSHNIYKDHPIYQISEKLQKDISIRKTDYEEVFENDFFDINMIIEGITACHNYDDRSTDLNNRELQIIKNFKSIYEYYPKGKYYGQWGCAHISLKENSSDLKNNFAYVLNSSYDNLKGKIFPIYYIYALPSNDKYKELIKPFSSYLNENTPYSIFKTYGNDCPFDVPSCGLYGNDTNPLSTYVKSVVIIQNYKTLR